MIKLASWLIELEYVGKLDVVEINLRVTVGKQLQAEITLLGGVSLGGVEMVAAAAVAAKVGYFPRLISKSPSGLSCIRQSC